MNNFNLKQDTDSQALLNQIVLDYMREKKRKRFWSWIKRFLIILIIILVYFNYKAIFTEAPNADDNSHVGLIDLNGTISDSEVNADSFAKGLKAAYGAQGLKALIIRINSPGGSPVQADYMFNMLQGYRKKYPAIKTYAVCVDYCASAAYYIAASADYIYANESSMVGSIGVIYNGFGFVDALDKIGVSRRLITAGQYKGFLDPFSPVDPNQTVIIKGMMDEIHQQFISKVKLGRGARLLIDDLTFSGLFWTGIDAKKRGLIDGFASSSEVANDIVKVETIVNYSYKQSVLEQVSKNIGMAIANNLPSALGLAAGIKA